MLRVLELVALVLAEVNRLSVSYPPGSLDFAEIGRLDSKFRLTSMATTEGRIITVGVTGASGAAYARAVARLLDADRRVKHVFLVASDAGLRLLSAELGMVAADAKKLPSLLTGTAAKNFEYLSNKDIGASIASGSTRVDAMAVVPCSAGALGSIAAGTAGDLLTRAADVCLKERRPLVLCLRETPLNRIHLENMLRVHDAGATVMPAMPAFYYGPKTIADIVEQFAYRVLAQIGLPQQKQYRWKGRP
jgi:flavin prenyltransferase